MRIEIENLISFVIPCYCSEHTIRDVINEIRSEVGKQSLYTYEVILVNDYSADNTLKEITALADEDPHIVVVDFPRNFGQASAQMAGFNQVHGQYVVSMDDDGQMPVESVLDLIEELKKGYDLVFGRYDEIKQKWYRNIGSWINVKMSETLIGQPKDVRITSFWAGKRYIIDEIVRYDGAFPYVGGLLLRTTKNMTSIPVEQRERVYGNSGYTLRKLLRLWMNGFTAFSVLPLRFATFCGMIAAGFGFMLGLITVIRKIIHPEMLAGYASMEATLLFIGGMIMLLLGIIGEYVGRTYISINRAPQFVVKTLIDHRGDVE